MSIETNKLMNLGDGQILYNDLRNRIENQEFTETIDTAAAIQSFEGGAWPMGIQIAVDPVQDLHGYSNPWPGGGGKNLFQRTFDVDSNYGIQYTYNDDGTIVATGTATAVSAINVGAFTAKAGVAYLLTGTPTSVTDNEIFVRFHGPGGSDYTFNIAANKDNPEVTIQFDTDTSGYVGIRIGNGKTVNGLVFKPMIRLASVSDATFEPYSNICPITGWTGAKVTVTGKNLLNRDGQNTTYNGVTYTFNDDGTILVNGTASALSYTTAGHIVLEANKTYILTGGHSSTTYLVVAGHPTWRDNGSGVTFTPTETLNAYVQAVVSNGKTASNAVLYPMIRLAIDEDPTFEPYNSVTTYPITFPTSAGTVYGGNLTVNKDETGTLVVDRASLTIPTIESYDGTVSQTTFNYTTIIPNPAQKPSNEEAMVTSDVLQGIPYVDRRTKAFSCYGTTSPRIIISVDGNYSVADFNSNIAGHKIVYILKETQSYTLTAPQVLSLIGKNHVWADCGDILSLTYNSKQGMEFIREDTAGQITTKLDPVKEELENTEATMAIVIDGDTAPKNITQGQYLFIKNHSTLATGAYHAISAIASGASVTNDNVTADTNGFTNAIWRATPCILQTTWGTTLHHEPRPGVIHGLVFVNQQMVISIWMPSTNNICALWYDRTSNVTRTKESTTGTLTFSETSVSGTAYTITRVSGTNEFTFTTTTNCTITYIGM